MASGKKDKPEVINNDGMVSIKDGHTEEMLREVDVKHNSPGIFSIIKKKTAISMLLQLIFQA